MHGLLILDNVGHNSPDALGIQLWHGDEEIMSDTNIPDGGFVQFHLEPAEYRRHSQVELCGC